MAATQIGRRTGSEIMAYLRWTGRRGTAGRLTVTRKFPRATASSRRGGDQHRPRAGLPARRRNGTKKTPRNLRAPHCSTKVRGWPTLSPSAKVLVVGTDVLRAHPAVKAGPPGGRPVRNLVKPIEDRPGNGRQLVPTELPRSRRLLRRRRPGNRPDLVDGRRSPGLGPGRRRLR